MTAFSSTALPTAAPAFSGTRGNPLVLALATALLGAGAIYLAQAVNLRQSGLWLVGALLGVSLYHALFGFTHAWRAVTTQGRGAGVRAQMLMLAVGVLLFFPVLHLGGIAGQSAHGLLFPAGLSVLVGAFIFGIGMQLGGGCASGTLFNAGAGNTRMLLTLVFFVVGAVLAALQYAWWSKWPALAPLSLVRHWGLWPALLSHLLVFGLITMIVRRRERRRYGRVDSIWQPASGHTAWLRGPWPLAWGALALVALNFATLLLAGRPWGIVNAFPIWGSKLIMATDIVDPTEWPYWMKDLMPLISPLQEDVTSIMNIGLILGATIAAALAGRFALEWKIAPRAALASIVGGILLGYGSRLAFGCNIGAYFSGMLSGSLHAWLWLPAAFAGSLVGVRLRPWFGLGRD